MNLPFSLPPVKTSLSPPIWNGDGFLVNNEFVNVLQYSENMAGWTNDLTVFHEESAGDNHFIDKASREYALQQITDYIRNKGDDAVILEIGCASGFMLEKIHKTFPNVTLLGSDVIMESLQKISNVLPHIPLFCFDMQHCPLPSQSVDAVVMLNVLEHIENDSLALQQAYRILKPGGIIVIEVPAGPNLYDIYDKLLMHYRRYVLSDLCRLIESENFKIVKSSHLGFFLYPAFYYIKQRNKKFLSEAEAFQRQQVNQAINKTGGNKLLHSLMKIELGLGKLFSYPFGIRCLITGRKE